MKSPAIPKPKILVVDDEPDNLDLLYRTFYREYKVLRAESGPAALEILEQEGGVAVIISDQRMPMMSGTEFLSLTATRYPDIIRIILTGYTDVEDLVEAINAGKVFKYVTKPWDAEELKLLVRQAWDTHNVLKVRTEELTRSLRRESLLNTVTNTIRNAQYGRLGSSPLKQILQIIVNTVGHMMEVDVCILRPFQEGRLAKQWFIYQSSKGENLTGASLVPSLASTSGIWGETLWETEDIEVINDVALDDRFLEEIPDHQNRRLAYQQANIRSSLIVPLISQQSLIAVMALHQYSEPYQWEDDEIQMVVMVADQAALALSQARAFEQLRALATQQALVNTITTAIRSSLDPQEIFTAITQQLGEAMDVDACALSLWGDDDEFVQCVGLYEKPETATPLPDYSLHSLSQSLVPISGNPVLQQLLITNQPVAIEDLQANPQLNGFDLPLRTPARALLVVPLLADGKIIGSITLRQLHRPRLWPETEINLAQAVAAQASIAVQQSRLYQKTRQQAERLMELDRQKTEFFQNISHEFRTPLTLMIGPLESAANQSHGLPQDQSIIALRNSRRLLRLVNQLLDLQRLDAGRMQASFRPCNMAEFVQQIVEAFRPYCEKKGLTINTQLIPCPPIYIDAEKFDKVLYNLLSNAMKFTGNEGQITVKLEPAGTHVRLQVSDTGIGIRPEQIPHLFERFRQAEGSVNRSYEGSGLGLSLVKELVEMHGGQISVESEYQQGTTFVVWLHTGTGHLPLDQVLEIPTEIQASRASVELADLEAELQNDTENAEFQFFLEDKDQALVTPISAANSSNASSNASSNTSNNQVVNSTGSLLPPPLKAKILVVDDNPDLRGYVSAILRENGYQILLARNGREGFQVAQKYQPQLIVTDLMMPEVSGLELVQMVRQQPQLQGIPIILLTAKADEVSRLEGTETGADAYLSKPFNDRELLAEVRNLLALKANEQKVLDLNQYLTQSVLSRFLPPGMVAKAATGEMSLDLRPEPRLITILFSDIVGFTQLANTLRSRRVAELLNEYLEAMTRAVFTNGGTVDKFMGDAILALFGAPEELSPNEQVRRAIAAAKEMQGALAVLNQRWQELGIVGDNGPPPVQFRCGIHQGTAVVGLFGGEQRSDYTAIGPSVNISARLQQAAQPNSILVSAAVADYLEEAQVTKGSPLKLKGVDETVLTFFVK